MHTKLESPLPLCTSISVVLHVIYLMNSISNFYSELTGTKRNFNGTFQIRIYFYDLISTGYILRWLLIFLWGFITTKPYVYVKRIYIILQVFDFITFLKIIISRNVLYKLHYDGIMILWIQNIFPSMSLNIYLNFLMQKRFS